MVKEQFSFRRLSNSIVMARISHNIKVNQWNAIPLTASEQRTDQLLGIKYLFLSFSLDWNIYGNGLSANRSFFADHILIIEWNSINVVALSIFGKIHKNFSQSTDIYEGRSFPVKSRKGPYLINKHWYLAVIQHFQDLPNLQ